MKPEFQVIERSQVRNVVHKYHPKRSSVIMSGNTPKLLASSSVPELKIHPRTILQSNKLARKLNPISRLKVLEFSCEKTPHNVRLACIAVSCKDDFEQEIVLLLFGSDTRVDLLCYRLRLEEHSFKFRCAFDGW